MMVYCSYPGKICLNKALSSDETRDRSEKRNRNLMAEGIYAGAKL